MPTKAAIASIDYAGRILTSPKSKSQSKANYPSKRRARKKTKLEKMKASCASSEASMISMESEVYDSAGGDDLIEDSNARFCFSLGKEWDIDQTAATNYDGLQSDVEDDDSQSEVVFSPDSQHQHQHNKENSTNYSNALYQETSESISRSRSIPLRSHSELSALTNTERSKASRRSTKSTKSSKSSSSKKKTKSKSKTKKTSDNDDEETAASKRTRKSTATTSSKKSKKKKDSTKKKKKSKKSKERTSDSETLTIDQTACSRESLDISTIDINSTTATIDTAITTTTTKKKRKSKKKKSSSSSEKEGSPKKKTSKKRSRSKSVRSSIEYSGEDPTEVTASVTMHPEDYPSSMALPKAVEEQEEVTPEATPPAITTTTKKKKKTKKKKPTTTTKKKKKPPSVSEDDDNNENPPPREVIEINTPENDDTNKTPVVLEEQQQGIQGFLASISPQKSPRGERCLQLVRNAQNVLKNLTPKPIKKQRSKHKRSSRSSSPDAAASNNSRDNEDWEAAAAAATARVHEDYDDYEGSEYEGPSPRRTRWLRLVETTQELLRSIASKQERSQREQRRQQYSQVSQRDDDLEGDSRHLLQPQPMAAPPSLRTIDGGEPEARAGYEAPAQALGDYYEEEEGRQMVSPSRPQGWFPNPSREVAEVLESHLPSPASEEEYREAVAATTSVVYEEESEDECQEEEEVEEHEIIQTKAQQLAPPSMMGVYGYEDERPRSDSVEEYQSNTEDYNTSLESLFEEVDYDDDDDYHAVDRADEESVTEIEEATVTEVEEEEEEAITAEDLGYEEHAPTTARDVSPVVVERRSVYCIQPEDDDEEIRSEISGFLPLQGSSSSPDPSEYPDSDEEDDSSDDEELTPMSSRAHDSLHLRARYAKRNRRNSLNLSQQRLSQRHLLDDEQQKPASEEIIVCDSLRTRSTVAETVFTDDGMDRSSNRYLSPPIHQVRFNEKASVVIGLNLDDMSPMEKFNYWTSDDEEYLTESLLAAMTKKWEARRKEAEEEEARLDDEGTSPSADYAAGLARSATPVKPKHYFGCRYNIRLRGATTNPSSLSEALRSI